MEVIFAKRRYKLIITDHAQLRMKSRDITSEMLVDIILTGRVKPKGVEGRYWIYKNFSNRNDNFVCLSVVVEEPNLIVVTALVSWRPEL
jgi:hypothetical protein